MIHHIAIWVSSIEKMKQFYERYFCATVCADYHNPSTGFHSCFLDMGDGTKLELMQNSHVKDTRNSKIKELLGLAHISLSVGSREAVKSLTDRLVRDGYSLASAPRVTGDGYYESAVFDPELNKIEITV